MPTEIDSTAGVTVSSRDIVPAHEYASVSGFYRRLEGALRKRHNLAHGRLRNYLTVSSVSDEQNLVSHSVDKILDSITLFGMIVLAMGTGGALLLRSGKSWLARSK